MKNLPVATIVKNVYSVAFILLAIFGMLSVYGMTNGGNVSDAAKLLSFSLAGILIITFLLRKSLLRLLFLYSGISIIGLMAIATAPPTLFETAGVITTFGLTGASIITFIYRKQYQKQRKSLQNTVPARSEKK